MFRVISYMIRSRRYAGVSPNNAVQPQRLDVEAGMNNVE